MMIINLIDDRECFCFKGSSVIFAIITASYLSGYYFYKLDDKTQIYSCFNPHFENYIDILNTKIDSVLWSQIYDRFKFKNDNLKVINFLLN